MRAIPGTPTSETPVCHRQPRLAGQPLCVHGWHLIVRAGVKQFRPGPQQTRPKPSISVYRSHAFARHVKWLARPRCNKNLKVDIGGGTAVRFGYSRPLKAMAIGFRFAVKYPACASATEDVLFAQRPYVQRPPKDRAPPTSRGRCLKPAVQGWLPAQIANADFCSFKGLGVLAVSDLT